MNRLIRLFGSSSNGKDEKLNSNLNIYLKKTIILDKSIEYISKNKTDNITEKRIEMIDDIILLCSQKNNIRFVFNIQRL